MESNPTLSWWKKEKLGLLKRKLLKRKIWLWGRKLKIEDEEKLTKSSHYNQNRNVQSRKKQSTAYTDFYPIDQVGYALIPM